MQKNIEMNTDVKILLIKNFELNKKTQTKHNNIYEGETLVLIENVVTGQLKIKPKRR